MVLLLLELSLQWRNPSIVTILLPFLFTSKYFKLEYPGSMTSRVVALTKTDVINKQLFNLLVQVCLPFYYFHIKYTGSSFGVNHLRYNELCSTILYNFFFTYFLLRDVRYKAVFDSTKNILASKIILSQFLF